MPKKEKMVKKVEYDEKGNRNITWVRQMVEVNPVTVPPVPLGMISLPLGRVFVNDNRGMPKRQLFHGDLVKTLPKSRVEIKLPSGGEVGEEWIVRIGEQSEFLITRDNLEAAAENFGIQQKDRNLYEVFKSAFGEKNTEGLRMPTAVAAIRG
jgi:hypothetical protein